jgi:hypothetical protein
MTEVEILAEFPDMMREDIRSCLAFKRGTGAIQTGCWRAAVRSGDGSEPPGLFDPVAGRKPEGVGWGFAGLIRDNAVAPTPIGNIEETCVSNRVFQSLAGERGCKCQSHRSTCPRRSQGYVRREPKNAMPCDSSFPLQVRIANHAVRRAVASGIVPVEFESRPGAGARAAGYGSRFVVNLVSLIRPSQVETVHSGGAIRNEPVPETGTGCVVPAGAIGGDVGGSVDCYSLGLVKSPTRVFELINLVMDRPGEPIQNTQPVIRQ